MALEIESKVGQPEVLGSLGIRLQKIRIQRGFTQQGLGDRSGIPGSHISRIENGHRLPSLETLERLAAALQLPTYSFFYPAEVPQRSSSVRFEHEVKNIIEKARKKNGGTNQKFLLSLKSILPRLTAVDCALILSLARRMAATRPPKS
jgi:transcriptional regulator with XRE-family HTH domain